MWDPPTLEVTAVVRGIYQFIKYLQKNLFAVRRTLINPRRACAARVTVVVLCVCLAVCLSVSPHAILAVRAITSKTKDTIVLSVEFEAII